MPSANSSPARLLAAGYLTLDLIVRDVGTGDYWQAIGGTCGNVTSFTSALGLDVTILARIGEDARGQLLLHSLKAARVGASQVERVPHLSTPAVVELVRGGADGSHRFRFECPRCEARLPKSAVVSMRRAEEAIKSISEFDAFFFDRATSATIRLAEAARDAGLLVVFEPTAVPRTAAAERAAAASDILKVSEQPKDAMGAWRPSRGASTRFIVETLGSRGLRFRARTPHGWRTWKKAPAVEQSQIRDTAGAGDWLTAGLLAALVGESASLDVDIVGAALEYGQRLSAISLRFDGPSGTLAALGAPTIRRIASGGGPIQLPADLSTFAPEQRNQPSAPAGHCDLCLTKAGSGS